MRNEMTKEMFANEVAKLVGGEVRFVAKNNGITYTGIEIRKPGNSVAPVVYVDRHYEDGLSVNETAEYVNRIINDNPDYMDMNLDLGWFADFEKVKHNLRVGLLNEAMNDAIEVKKNAFEYGFSDLIMFPYVQLTSEQSIRIRNSHIEMWGITPDEVFNIALQNMEDEVEVTWIGKIIGLPIEMMDQMPMQVVYRKNNGIYGAAAILTKAVRNLLPEKFVVLPSSVDEVIVLPLGNLEQDAMELASMISEVNRKECSQEEVLSNKPYYFE